MAQRLCFTKNEPCNQKVGTPKSTLLTPYRRLIIRFGSQQLSVPSSISSSIFQTETLKDTDEHIDQAPESAGADSIIMGILCRFITYFSFSSLRCFVNLYKETIFQLHCTLDYGSKINSRDKGTLVTWFCFFTQTWGVFLFFLFFFDPFIRSFLQCLRNQ